MHTAYLGLGSNVGNRAQYLNAALKEIYQSAGRITAVSSVYKTSAQGFEGDYFYNLVLAVETPLTAEELLAQTQIIERQLGRTAKSQAGKYANRCIDIDLLTYADEVLQTQDLNLPHPEVLNRNFVLVPFAEIAPELKLPNHQKTLEELLKQSHFSNTSIEKLSEIKLDLPVLTVPHHLNYVVIEGNIGSGKTTLVQQICQEFQARGVYEGFEDNPFLEAFYKDQDRYALPTEMSFMVERYQQIQSELRQMDLFKRFVISDYHLTKSLVFATNTLKENEFGLFKQVFDILFSKIPKPDAYIYLYRAPEELMSNIQQRGRSYEQNISADYLQNIHQSYMRFLKSQPDIPLKIIDVTGKDFKASRVEFLDLVQEIFKE